MTFIPEALRKAKEVYYPDSDGKPMADNTLQFNYIVGIKTNLEILYKKERVFVAGDLFWYPVKGQPKTVVAPDVLVAYDRPKGYRGSYKQWEEGDVIPQVVFEVLSHSNTTVEMLRKLKFYNTYGVQEFIIVDPYKKDFIVHVRENGKLEEVEVMGSNWTSPLMGITVEKGEEDVLFYFPNGHPFRSPEEWNAMFEAEVAAKDRALEEKDQVFKIIEEERLAKDKALKELAALKAELEKLKSN